MGIEVPSILQVPPKLVPIITQINDYKYFLLEGGRGGGKSQSVSRYLLYLAEHKKLRIVCGREIQNSITESVYSLMADLIQTHSLNFEVMASKIIHRESGSTINFRGFREQGAFNIQGMEGVHIIWIDEAQALTKPTLDKLIPTIRKENAKIFFSMNRHVPDDPAFEFCFGRPDCLHININFFDNPFCPNTLKMEAKMCEGKSAADYDHIWLGNPLSKSEDAVFSQEELKETGINRHPPMEAYGMRLAGFDIARYGDDKCAYVVLQQMGVLHWEVVFVDQWDHKDLNYTTGRILMTANEQKVQTSIIDEDGMGAGPLDTLNKGRGLNNFLGFKNPTIGYQNNRFYGNNRTVNTFKLKDMILKGHLAITQPDLIKELCTLKYIFDHQQRKILISKQMMRDKFKIKSPNQADALIMAVSLVGEVKAKQDSQYYPMPKQYQDDNLFAIAGIK